MNFGSLEQHIEGAISSWIQRQIALSEPHYSLRDLAEHDGILESHLEGLRLAGEAGWELAVEGLQWEEPGEVFVAAVLAFESGEQNKIERVLQTIGDTSELRRALISALGWLTWEQAEPWAIAFAESPRAFLRYAGVATFDIHRQDPGNRLESWLQNDNASVQSRAVQAVGTLARTDKLHQVAELLDSEDEELHFQACWTTALRARSNVAMAHLFQIAGSNSPYADPAARLLMSAAELQPAAELVNQLAQGNSQQLRLATILSGLLGTPDSIPWLIEMMKQPEYARVAGESFSRITGLRLDQRPFEGDWPAGFEAGPNEDPEDENVEMDPDENLPFPNPQVVAAWWQENQTRFAPNTRYLLGWELANEAWLKKILVLGRQRERATAALELALLHPTQPLFEIRANGNRQIKQLEAGRLPTEEYRCYAIEAGPE